MSNHLRRTMLAAMLLAGWAGTADAAQETASSQEMEIKPLLDARLRYEHVDQALDAEALTLRLRGGAEAKAGRFAILAEGEATVAPINDYNAFPFPLDDDQRRPQYAVVADPTNFELNRLQLSYASETAKAILGRQRINLDDQRWVGSVGWRQNEQTFDALRGEATVGRFAVDLTYAIDQRTIFGNDAGPRASADGDFVFAGLGANAGPVRLKAFAYVVDYEEGFLLTSSSQTYGGIASTAVPVGGQTSVALRASYARQFDAGANPFDYAADYWSFEGSSKLAEFAFAAGWEELGSDNGRAVQTPLATLHKFNGWADLFLTTPPAGLRDAWFSIGRSFDGNGQLPGLNANLTYHRFGSAAGGLAYGTEWDGSIGFRVGRIGFLAKFAAYEAASFGADTRKIWLQAEWAF